MINCLYKKYFLYLYTIITICYYYSDLLWKLKWESASKPKRFRWSDKGCKISQ